MGDIDSLMSSTVFQESLCRTCLFSELNLVISEFKRVKGISLYSTNTVPLEHLKRMKSDVKKSARKIKHGVLNIGFLLIKCIVLKATHQFCVCE